MKKAINAVVIKDGCILLVRKKGTWILPGGKPEPGETDKQCLLREVTEEELPRLVLENLMHFGDFFGTTPHGGDELVARVYLAEASGDITPGAEIDKAEWVKKPEEYPLSDITRKIIVSLQQKGHLQ